MKALEQIEIYADKLAENKLFIGLVMVIVNIGARFIIEELSDEQRAFVKSDIARKVIVFSSVFMATRDLGIAAIVTLIFIILFKEILKKDEKDVTNDKPKANSAKQELDKKIDELKLIKDSL